MKFSLEWRRPGSVLSEENGAIDVFFLSLTKLQDPSEQEIRVEDY